MYKYLTLSYWQESIPISFSKELELTMRGISIFIIMLHNMLHLYPQILQECEFNYFPDRIQAFFHILRHGSPYYLYDMISFLGVYGVSTFVFLSGYGLVMKYDTPHLQSFFSGSIDTPSNRFDTSRFLLHNWRKLVKLMLIAILFFVIYNSIGKMLQDENADWKSIWQNILPLSCLNGIVDYWWHTDPGIYWYFGLAFELYILYALLVYGRSLRWIWMLTVLCLMTIWLRRIPNFSHAFQLEACMRHNFIGWMLPFTIGVWIGKCPRLPRGAIWGAGIMAAILFLPSLGHLSTWQFSFPFSLSIIIALSLLALHIPYFNRFWIMTGRLSAFIFVAHPIVRTFYPYHLNPALTICIGYVIFVYLASILYKYLTACFFANTRI